MMLVRSMILCVSMVSASAIKAQSGTQLRIALITPSTPTAASLAIARGVRLGVTEAAQTAKLFGGNVQLFETMTGPNNVVASARSLLATRKIQVLISASPMNVAALIRFAEARHIVFLNVASRSVADRSICEPYTFHVEASDAMYATAMARRSAQRGAADSAVLWDASLSRFGASELNNRFARTFSAGMNGGSWAGWAAVKFVAEAALRARSTQPAEIARYFASVPTQFDGHKGWPLSFRPSDHQLRQPLYIVATRNGAQRAVIDVPDLRALTSGMAGNANELLDKLVPASTTAACHSAGDAG